jgi:hypothetical protein
MGVKRTGKAPKLQLAKTKPRVMPTAAPALATRQIKTIVKPLRGAR